MHILFIWNAFFHSGKVYSMKTEAFAAHLKYDQSVHLYY